jgi:site-specific DNA-adenine methylase
VWAQCWIGRKGKGGTKGQGGGSPSVRRTANGGNNASRLVAAAGDLEGWAEQLRRCEWECLSFRSLLPKVADSKECGIYCDPPWVGPGSAYIHNFTNKDHWDLCLKLDRFKETTVVVRYGDNPLIRELYQNMYQGWHTIQAESRVQSNAVKGEVWFVRNLVEW